MLPGKQGTNDWATQCHVLLSEWTVDLAKWMLYNCQAHPVNGYAYLWNVRELTTHKCIQHAVGTYFAISELVVGELTPWTSCWTKVDWGIGLLHHLIVSWHKVGMEVCLQYAFDCLGFLFQILERQTCTHVVCMYVCILYACSCMYVYMYAHT